MAHLIGADSISLAFPTVTVLDGVTVGLAQGDRIGIVGRNGVGKSTLLELLAGRMIPDAGRVTMRGGTSIALLEQADTLPEGATIRQCVVGDRPEHEWATVPRVREVLSGLLSDVSWDDVVGELSGGQRRRVDLARLLVREDDVLLLDEPTNHLDMAAITWLAGHLKRRWAPGAGALAVVTHDRWFLDEVCNHMWEVHDGTVDPFDGGYAAWVLARVERDRQAAATEARRRNLMRKELAWLRRGAPARTSKPRFRIEAANQLIAGEPPVRDSVELTKLATARLGKDVVDLVDVSAGYGGEPVLQHVTWRIAPGERSGVLGANGAGKSTLLALVAGTLAPTSGRVKQGKTVRLATLSQELGELDDLAGDRVSDVIARYRTTYAAGGKELTPGQMLERLGFTSAHLGTRVGDLSGGQRRRLQLLLLLLDEPNVLILDEPSNDLDTDMLAALEDVLDTWPGTLLVVSHDRYLVERLTDQQYAVLDGQVRHVPGGVEEYLALETARGQAAVADAGAPVAGRGQNGALTGAQRRALEKEMAAVERRLARLKGEIRNVHGAMASHDQSDYQGLAQLTGQLRELEGQVGEGETLWLELAEQVEAG